MALGIGGAQGTVQVAGPQGEADLGGAGHSVHSCSRPSRLPLPLKVWAWGTLWARSKVGRTWPGVVTHLILVTGQKCVLYPRPPPHRGKTLPCVVPAP